MLLRRWTVKTAAVSLTGPAHATVSSSQPLASSFDRWGPWSVEKFKLLMEVPNTGKKLIRDTDSGPWAVHLSVKLLKLKGEVLPPSWEHWSSQNEDAGWWARLEMPPWTLEFMENKSLLVHSCDAEGGGVAQARTVEYSTGSNSSVHMLWPCGPWSPWNSSSLTC